MSREPTGRKERIPLGGQRLKMARPERKGFVRRWFNDVAGRIEEARNAGYRHVRLEGAEQRGEDARNTGESMIVGVQQDGTAQRAFLMEQPRNFYDEDQGAKQKPLDEFDEVLRRGNVVGADGKDKDSFYVPTQGISVKTGNE